MSSFLLALALTTPGVPDLSTLSPQQRTIFERVAQEEFCNCQSSLTLNGCFAARPDCKVAQHLGKMLVRSVSVGLSSDEILAFFSSRVSGPFCTKPAPLAIAGAPERGSKNAPITLVEFADFRCGHCREVAPMVKKALEQYGKRVRFVFAPFPLQNNSVSVSAAVAMLAAGNQGKQWEMHELLFAPGAEDFADATLVRLARQLELDVKRFEADLKSPALKQQVLAIKQAGLDAGIEATPTFFVNGRRFEPDPDLFTFADRFDLELDRSAGRCQ